jgi:hypothetical protein
MSNLSELLPAGAGAKSADFVASGTLGSGVTVVLNSDGTVEAVSATGGPPAVGTPVVYGGSPSSQGSVFDSNANKIVIAYRDSSNSNRGTAVVGTVSGTTITFGSPVVFAADSVTGVSIVFDSNAGKVVIFYANINSNFFGTSIVGTVSGTSISFGTAVVFRSEFVIASAQSSTFDSNSNKVVVAYRRVGVAGQASVGTVSGTSISFGSFVQFNSSDITSNGTAATFDSNSNKVVIAYTDSGNSDYGTALVGTVSGTSISFGSKSVYNSSAVSENQSATFDSSNNKVVIFYSDAGNAYAGTSIVGTVSGTSISFGSKSVFVTTTVNSGLDIVTVFETSSNKIILAYRDWANDKASAALATVSGTSISFGPAIDYATSSIYANTVAFDSVSNNAVISYNPPSSGTSSVFTLSGTTAQDFIGITDQAIADTATGAVIVQGGVSEKVTGLTTGSDYYVQADGTLSTTVSSVPAGRALSTTSILLEG